MKVKSGKGGAEKRGEEKTRERRRGNEGEEGEASFSVEQTVLTAYTQPHRFDISKGYNHIQREQRLLQWESSSTAQRSTAQEYYNTYSILKCRILNLSSIPF